ncbi:hypothetical protein ACFLV4_03390 [Chloroflexota bacterium]
MKKSINSPDTATKRIFDKIQMGSTDRPKYRRHLLTDCILPILFDVVAGLICIKWPIPGIVILSLVSGYVIGHQLGYRKAMNDWP